MNKIIAGRYELLKVVGRGGMSTVYLASDINLNKNWAVKVIKKRGIINGQKIENSLLTEAQIMKGLDHPSLPRIIDIIEDDEQYYIVMDYVEGENLRHIIDNYGPQSQDLVIKWAKELGLVLKYLHSQNPPIIYRDMKPGNIILQPSGTIKLIDFGTARTYKEGKDQDTAPLGTRGYAAPEQYNRGDGQLSQTDERTDIYNLGITIYELLTCRLPNKPPYKLIPLRQINPELSTGLERIIDKCTKSDPDERFQTADEFLTALLNYQKLDYEYVAKQKRIIKKTVIPLIIGCVLAVSGGGLLTADHVISANQYEALIAETGNSDTHIENLKKAIKINPAKADAYKKLMKEYAKSGRFQTEPDEIFEICSNGLKSVDKDSKEYVELNYMLGESYLVYFVGKTDNSLRNKILTAAPYFEEVVRSGDKEYENYQLAKVYVNLASFYEDYILDNNQAFVFDAGAKQYKNLIKDCNDAINLLSSSNNKNVQVQVATYQIILNIIDSERNNMATCIDKEELISIIDAIEKNTAKINTVNASLIDKKEDILKECKEEKESIDKTYKEAQKVETKQQERKVKE